MILETQLIKEQCVKISQAVCKGIDSDHSDCNITEVLELRAFNGILSINVTNKEYYVRVNIPVDVRENFRATVDADIFLKLISQITTPDISLSICGNSLLIEGNGSYRLPLIYTENEILELPEIVINNVTCEMQLPVEILHSILRYNSKEVIKKAVAQPVQRMYYVDNKGAITFTSSACVNNFELDQPVQMLLTNKVVKLFKLFEGEYVDFKLGYDALPNGTLQMKLSFVSKDVELTAITTNDSTLISSVPVSSIRSMADKVYPYTVTLNKDEMLQALNRLNLFSKSKDTAAVFEFDCEGLTISSDDTNNKEALKYDTGTLALSAPIKMMLGFEDVKSALESFPDKYATFNFGDNTERAITISRNNVKSVIPKIVYRR